MKAKRKIVWMLSGQGSQYRGMGRDLYDQEPVFRESMDRCDRIVRPWIRASLAEIVYGDGPSGDFEDTRVTHPAICAVQYAMARTLQARGHAPDLLLGYSLGVTIAHVVAETVPLETGLELLHRHASLMESATPTGGMLAILENPEALAPLLHDIPGVWIAARNFENHCVVSGTLEALDRLQQRLEARQATVQRLPVRRAFHSPLMDPAEEGFRSCLHLIRPETPRFEIVSAADASDGSLNGAWGSTREPVDFLGAIRDLESACPGGCAYVDLGPSGTLSTFVKYIGIRPESAYFPTVTPWGRAQKNMHAYESSL